MIEKIFRFEFKMLLFRLWAGFLLLYAYGLPAQEGNPVMAIPITVSVFSESVSLPNFRGLFKSPGWGIRIGTEFYYRKNDGRQLLQTINLGYYNHDGFQQGLFVSSEFGYRRFLGDFFFDATIGGGYLHLLTDLKRYEPQGDSYVKSSQHLHKFMPTVGLGLGYRFEKVMVFSRYEAFGELPFSYKGTPLLPHKALHLGTRFYPFP